MAGISQRRIDPEEHVVYRALATFFDSSCCTDVPRRSLSAGPAPRTPQNEEAQTSRVNPGRGPNIQRRFSTGRTVYQREPISMQSDSSDDPPTPPYSPLERDDESSTFDSGSPTSSARSFLVRTPSSGSASSHDSGTGRLGRRKVSFNFSTVLDTIKLSPRTDVTSTSSEAAKEFKKGKLLAVRAFDSRAVAHLPLSRHVYLSHRLFDSRRCPADSPL
jgi:hypothetical protein